MTIQLKNTLIHGISFFLGLLLFCLVSQPSAGPPELMLPQVDDGERDLSGWWMSEKLDGIRGYWDGRRLWSKNGRMFYPPEEFIAGLPDFALDGELWGGRGTFEQTVSIVRQDRPHSGWLRLKFAVFDVPGGNGPFYRRIEQAKLWFARHPSAYAFVIVQSTIHDRDQVRREVQRVEAAGGEGLVVRDPQACYAAGRSSKIFKVKSFADAEAVVVDYIPGRGANSGHLGSLLVERKDGMRFRIGTGFNQDERENPPPIGSVITYKYYGFYQSGRPRFPVFLRVRRDHDW